MNLELNCSERQSNAPIQQAMSAALAKKPLTLVAAKKANEDKGIALAPSQKDRNPWYTSVKTPQDEEDGVEPEIPIDDPEAIARTERKQRDLSYKSFNDPLATVNSYLAKKDGGSSSSRPSTFRNGFGRNNRPAPSNSKPSGSSNTSNHDAPAPAPGPTPPPAPVDPLAARLSRETSERERAKALLARKKREMAGLDTPRSEISSTDGYGDVYNRVDTANARARWKGWEGHARGGEQARRGW